MAGPNSEGVMGVDQETKTRGRKSLEGNLGAWAKVRAGTEGDQEAEETLTYICKEYHRSLPFQ